jgi:hypothetical protein
LGKKEFIAGEITWVDFALGEALQILNQLAPEIVLKFHNLIHYK